MKKIFNAYSSCLIFWFCFFFILNFGVYWTTGDFQKIGNLRYIIAAMTILLLQYTGIYPLLDYHEIYYSEQAEIYFLAVFNALTLNSFIFWKFFGAISYHRLVQLNSFFYAVYGLIILYIFLANFDLRRRSIKKVIFFSASLITLILIISKLSGLLHWNWFYLFAPIFVGTFYTIEFKKSYSITYSEFLGVDLLISLIFSTFLLIVTHGSGTPDGRSDQLIVILGVLAFFVSKSLRQLYGQDSS